MNRNKDHFIDFLSGEPRDDISPELQPYIGSAHIISSVPLYHEYHDRFWDKLYGIEQSSQVSIEEERRHAEQDEYILQRADEEELQSLVREIVLQTHRGVRFFREAKEQEQNKLVSALIGRIMQIRLMERAQGEDPNMQNRFDDVRRLLGYHPSLPKRGFPLPLHYLITDTILPYFQKKGDTNFVSEYEDPHTKFEGLEGLVRFFSNPDLDRSYREIEVYDPELPQGKQRRLEIHVNDRKGVKIYRTALLDTIKRAEFFFKKIKKEVEALDSLDSRTADQENRRLTLHGILNRLSGRTSHIDEIRKRLAFSQQEKEQTLAKISDKEKKRLLEEQIDAITDRGRYALQLIYQECIGSEELWSDFAVRIAKDQKINHVRLVYVVLRDGTFLCNISKETNDVKLVTHSELAGGRNIYAAGELVFEKSGSTWGVREINNGSGHYKPDGRCLYYVTTILKRAGFDVSNARRIDSILRIDLDTGYMLRYDQVSPVADPDA